MLSSGESDRVVFDTNNVAYMLEKKLGHGGQGAVWGARLDRGVSRELIVVKLFREEDVEDRADVLRRVERLTRLDLKPCNVAGPERTLRDRLGYVMKLLDDMVPLEPLLIVPEAVDSLDAMRAWFTETGGSRRRLRVLAHLADALNELHARGLVYGDLSPANCFISADPTQTKAWLIDADNVDWSPRGFVGTPGYRAPETIESSVDGRPRGSLTSLSDAWSLAVIVIRAMMFNHPFEGEALYNATGEYPIETAIANGRPWIGDPQDDSNSTKRGLPASYMLSNGLRSCANRTFGEGRNDIALRPGVGAWASALHFAADTIIDCAHCRADYLAGFPNCPWCETKRPPLVAVLTQFWNPERSRLPARLDGTTVPLLDTERIAVRVLPVDGTTIALNRRFADFVEGVSGQEPVATLRYTGNKVRLLRSQVPTVPLVFSIQSADGSVRETSVVEETAIERHDVVHFGELDKPHKVAVFKY